MFSYLTSLAASLYYGNNIYQSLKSAASGLQKNKDLSHVATVEKIKTALEPLLSKYHLENNLEIDLSDESVDDVEEELKELDLLLQ